MPLVLRFTRTDVPADSKSPRGHSDRPWPRDADAHCRQSIDQRANVIDDEIRD